MSGPACTRRLPQSLQRRLFQAIPSRVSPLRAQRAQYYGYYTLPVGYQQVVLNGITYYLFNGVYYQAYMYGGQTMYLVFRAPV